MKSIKNSLVKVLCSLFLLTIISSAFPIQALAYTMLVTNNYSQTLHVALFDWSNKEGEWHRHGWYNVDPHNSRELKMPGSTQKNKVYVYAYTSEATFGGDGYAGTIARVVSNSSFDCWNKDDVPPGRNPRTVVFAPYEIEEGWVTFEP